jgi:prevent-host-death family protein
MTTAEWKVGEAKQRFSEVLRRAREEPQRIYNRERLVAAVLDATLFESFEEWQKRRARRTLEDDFSELREICQEEGYELELEVRRDRERWITDVLDDEAS